MANQTGKNIFVDFKLEATLNTAPSTGSAERLRLTPSPGLTLRKQSIRSNEIRSDGLTTMLVDERIRVLIEEAASLEAATRALVDEANVAGGRDNITVLLFQIEDPTNPLPRSGQPTLISRARGRWAQPSSPAAGGRRGLGIGRVLLRVAVGLLIVGVLLGGAFVASRQVWFLGTDDAGRVALYQGVPFEFPFGLSLYQRKYSAPVQTSELGAQRREAVTGHSFRSREDATSLIEDIESSEGS